MSNLGWVPRGTPSSQSKKTPNKLLKRYQYECTESRVFYEDYSNSEQAWYLVEVSLLAVTSAEAKTKNVGPNSNLIQIDSLSTVHRVRSNEWTSHPLVTGPTIYWGGHTYATSLVWTHGTPERMEWLIITFWPAIEKQEYRDVHIGHAKQYSRADPIEYDLWQEQILNLTLPHKRIWVPSLVTPNYLLQLLTETKDYQNSWPESIKQKTTPRGLLANRHLPAPMCVVYSNSQHTQRILPTSALSHVQHRQHTLHLVTPRLRWPP